MLLEKNTERDLRNDIRNYCEAWHNQAVAWNGVRDTSATRKAIHTWTNILHDKWGVIIPWQLNQLALAADSRNPNEEEVKYYTDILVREVAEALEEKAVKEMDEEEALSVAVAG